MVVNLFDTASTALRWCFPWLRFFGNNQVSFFGVSSLTSSAVPAMITSSVYGLAATTAVFTVDDIYAGNGGYNYILDKVFHNNAAAYNACDFFLQFLNMAIPGYVPAKIIRLNGAEVKKGVQFIKGGSGSIYSIDMDLILHTEINHILMQILILEMALIVH